MDGQYVADETNRHDWSERGNHAHQHDHEVPSFLTKKTVAFSGRGWIFFWGGRVFCWGKIKKQSNLRTLHCGRDDSCRSVCVFFSVFFFKVAKWIFVWVLFSPPPFFNAKFPFAFKKNPWRMSWSVEEKPGKPHVGPQTRSRSQFTSLAEAGTNFERLGGFGVFKVRGCS